MLARRSSLISLVVASSALPALAQTIVPPAGNALFLSADGVGTQDYICLPGATAMSAPVWTFERPQASLAETVAGRFRLEVAEHQLDRVPGKATAIAPACVGSNLPGLQLCPSWRDPLDQSEVWGTKVASIPAGDDPLCPTPGAIACLLLKPVATSNGQFGASLFGNTTFIQRIDTTGGSAPTTSCSVGQIAQIPYTAKYQFYAKSE